MKYYYEKPKEWKSDSAKIYRCDHPLYSYCTLYTDDSRGLAVIQQRFNPDQKLSWWSFIDPWLVDDIFHREGFREYFSKYAKECDNGLYPTVTVRQIMWALRMKPLKKEFWENSQNLQRI